MCDLRIFTPNLRNNRRAPKGTKKPTRNSLSLATQGFWGLWDPLVNIATGEPQAPSWEGVRGWEKYRAHLGTKKPTRNSLVFLCPEQESNLHALNQALPPQSSVSTNFTIWANQYPVWGLQMYAEFSIMQRFFKYFLFRARTPIFEVCTNQTTNQLYNDQN